MRLKSEHTLWIGGAALLLAIVLGACGIYAIVESTLDAREMSRKERNGRLAEHAGRIKDDVLAAGRDEAVRQEALVRALRDEEGAYAAFVWAPGRGCIWTHNIAPGLKTRLDVLTMWKDWTRGGGRRRTGCTCFARDDGELEHVLWFRIESRLYAVVYRRAPESENVVPWPWASVLVVAVLALITVVALIGMMIHNARHDRREAARARSDAERERRENLEKTSFLACATHELKTPLAAISLWNALLEGDNLDEERRRQACRIIGEENERMLRLVDDILEYSRLEGDRRRYVLECVDLAQTARSVVEMLEAGFSEHGISCRGADGVIALADADAVTRIVMNLVGNAAKYAAAHGPVEVAAETAHGRARLSVADRGPGVPREFHKRVFDRFWRLDDSLTDEKGGLGLGLAISRTLARGMGGELTVADREGGGAVFTLELPVFPKKEEDGR